MNQAEYKEKFTEDLKGRHIKKGDKVAVRRWTVTNEIATVASGFGMNPDSHGSAVFIDYADGQSDRVERYDILAIEKENENA